MGNSLTVSYHKNALKALSEIDSKKVRQQIVNKIGGLQENGKPQGCAKMQGVEDETGEVYRLRSGDYRIIYLIRPTEIVVLDIGHRKDIYR
jgi:mRNA interferase RelE/StbE